jgi:hypothetical protein
MSRIAPWSASPCALISWWDMERFGAEKFVAIGNGLSHLSAIWSTPGNSGASVPDETKVNLRELLEAVRDRCAECGLLVSSGLADELVQRLDEPQSMGTFAGKTESLSATIIVEMRQALFMRIPAGRAKLYDLDEGFGADVANSFPSTSFDIKESGSSYATGRYTASVFHLMRALELGLVAMAKKLELDNIPENWQQLIDRIEKKLREMGKSQKSQAEKMMHEQFSQAASNFMVFKDAWRNYTAHHRSKYTEDEADAIYRNVKSFMQKLAAIGLRELECEP